MPAGRSPGSTDSRRTLDGHRVPQRAIAAQRAHAAQELDAGPAAEPLGAGDRDRADRAGPRHVRAAAGGDVEVLHFDQPQPARRGRAPCAAAASPPRRHRRSGSRPAGLPRRSGWPRPRRGRSRQPTRSGRDRSSTTRRRGESSRSARRRPGRTPPTARAARCAAACARSAAPSRSARGPVPRAASRSTTCRIVPSSRSTTSTTATPPSGPVSNGCPPDVG